MNYSANVYGEMIDPTIESLYNETLRFSHENSPMNRRVWNTLFEPVHRSSLPFQNPTPWKGTQCYLNPYVIKRRNIQLMITIE